MRFCLFRDTAVGLLSTMVGVGNARTPGAGYAFVKGVGYAASLTGLLALGMLAGLVANRIGRLSSQ
jgi:hypothetical protein